MSENEALSKRLSLVEARLHGMIAGFEANKCPEGWKVYTKAQGRFLLGINEKDKAPKLSAIAPGATGGADSQTLTMKNIPAHYHLLDLGTLNNDARYGQGEEYSRAVYGTQRNKAFLSKTSTAGQESPDPISLIPPYVGLLFCIKD
ncbi:hypothetical protein GGQ85_004178 [Nitrobacter vulgaris]|nr:hypothetical protein [Nitrobacter vulgaris]